MNIGDVRPAPAEAPKPGLGLDYGFCTSAAKLFVMRKCVERLKPLIKHHVELILLQKLNLNELEFLEHDWQLERMLQLILNHYQEVSGSSGDSYSSNFESASGDDAGSKGSPAEAKESSPNDDCYVFGNCCSAVGR